MKKLICSIALVTTFVAFTSAQQIESNVTKVLTGKWQWIFYSGGAEGVGATKAKSHYAFSMRRVEGAPGLFYNCTVFKDSIYAGQTQMLVTEDGSNALFPYKLHHDITAPLFNGAGMPSVNFRIVENNVIEFSNGTKTDFRYLFKNVSDADGC